MTRINCNSHKSFSYNQPFIISKLLKCLHDSHLSASVHNGITYIMLNISPQSPLTIFRFLTGYLQNRFFPRVGVKPSFISFLKSVKDASNPNNYRRFALSSCLYILLEKMVSCHLISFLESNNCLAAFQSGFRHGRSTINNLIHLEHYIETALLKCSHLVSVFFDVAKA